MSDYTTVLARIQDLIGDDVTDISSYKDLIHSGFNHVADIIPITSELWLDIWLGEATSEDYGDSSDNKFIRVVVTNNNQTREAEEVEWKFLKRGEDSSSIYYNAGNYKNPIYSFDPDGDLIIKPDPDSVEVYYFTYFNSVDASSIFNTAGDEPYKMGFPQQAVFAGILKASLNLLQAKVSLAVQEEEDLELLQLLNGQVASIDRLYKEELQRLNLPVHLVGDGNDIK